MIKKELEVIFNQFAVTQGNYEFIPIDIGHINQTYKATNGVSNYLFQKINTSIFKEPGLLMKNIERVAQHLQEENYSKQILKPIYTNTRQIFSIDKNDNYWRVFPFFENTYSVNVAKNLSQVLEASQAFGEFVSVLRTIDVKRIGITISDFHNGTLRWQQFEEAIEKDVCGRKKAIEPLIVEIKEHQAIFQNINQIINKGDLPLRITHNDTKINNLLFDKNTHQSVAVIDWDTIMPNTILSDFGDLVRTFACSADEEEKDFSQIKFRLDIFKAICNGFSIETKNWLKQNEIECLAESGIWITFMQTIRFLGDYINGDIYYHTNYPNQNLNRAINQFTFLKEMLKNIEEMKQEIDLCFS